MNINTLVEVIIKEPPDLRHPEDSLQLRGQAENPQCWCDRQNKPSAGRFDGPEARETQHDAENDTFPLILTNKFKLALLLPGLFCRQEIYLTGWTVLVCQTAQYRRNYRSPDLKLSPPLLNNVRNIWME